MFAHPHYSTGMISMDNIIDVARRIGDKVDAEAVFLFGSHARGVADENSDVDFLVVAESDLPRFKRSRELYKLFRPHPFAMDILVYTPAEVERGGNNPFSFISTVLQEGKRVYAKRDRDRKTVADQS